MNDVENLTIDNLPKINISKFTIETEYEIDTDSEVSISINNINILDKMDIIGITGKIIEISNNIDLNKNDNVIVIYNRI